MNGHFVIFTVPAYFPYRFQRNNPWNIQLIYKVNIQVSQIEFPEGRFGVKLRTAGLDKEDPL